MRRRMMESNTSGMKKRSDKTSPRGMSPDMAHTSNSGLVSRRNMTVSETFDSSPRNAGRARTHHLK